MQSFTSMPDITSFLQAVKAWCKTTEVFTALTADMEAAKSEFWVPKDRKGSMGLRLFAVTYTTNKEETGLGYYLEVEIQLVEPQEYDIMTWILPVDPAADAIVGHIKGKDIKSWLIYPPPVTTLEGEQSAPED